MVKERAFLKTFDKAKELLSAYREEITQAKRQGVPVVWHSLMFPRGLTAGFDAVTIPGEWYSATSGPTHGVDLLDAVEACGFPHELCSYTRMSLGSMLTNKGFLGKFPKPDIVLGIEGNCNLEAKWMEFIARHFNIPLFILDYHGPAYFSDKFDEQAEKDAMEYFVQQAYHCIDFMEQVTGRKLNEEKLINTCIIRHRSREIWPQIAELWSTSVPSPIAFRDLLSYLPFVIFLNNRPQYVELARSLRDEVAQRVKEGVSGIPDERMRLDFSAPPPWYDLRMLRYLESRGAAVVSGRYFSFFINRFAKEFITGGEALVGLLRGWSEPTNVDECLRDIAKRWISTGEYIMPYHHQYVNLKQHIDHLIERCKVAKVDGVIYFSPRCCRRGSWGQLDERNAIRRELGIPTVIFEGSPADPRDYSRTQVDLRINTFLEQVMAAKERRARSG